MLSQVYIYAFQLLTNSIVKASDFETTHKMIGIFCRLARRVGGRQGLIESNANCCEDAFVILKTVLLSIDDDRSTMFHVLTTTMHA